MEEVLLSDALAHFRINNCRSCVSCIRQSGIDPLEAVQYLEGQFADLLLPLCADQVRRLLEIMPSRDAGSRRAYFFRIHECHIVVEVDRSQVSSQLWPASMILAEWLLGEDQEPMSGKVAIELGCGVGLLGLLPSLPFRSFVLTDLNVEVAQRNVEQNHRNSTVLVEKLDWKDDDHCAIMVADFVFMADVAYDVLQLPHLVACLQQLLRDPTTLCYWCEGVRDEEIFTQFETEFGRHFEVINKSSDLPPPRVFHDERRCKTGIDFIDNRIERRIMFKKKRG